MVIDGIVQYTSGFLPDILLFTQAPILVWFDGTIIDIISTILLTMYYSVYVFKEKSVFMFWYVLVSLHVC